MFLLVRLFVSSIFASKNLVNKHERLDKLLLICYDITID